MNSYRGLQDCDRSNKNRQFTCINEFLSQRLNCSFPWSNIKSKAKECSSSKELSQFYDLYTEILQQNMNEELKVFGCLPKNCIQDSWIPETLVTVDKKTLSNNPSFESYLVEDKTTIWFSTLSDEVISNKNNKSNSLYLHFPNFLFRLKLQKNTNCMTYKFFFLMLEATLDYFWVPVCYR